MSKKWEIQNHDGCDKSFALYPPDGVEALLSVDYDDVRHDKVDASVKEIVKTLNEAEDWKNKDNLSDEDTKELLLAFLWKAECLLERLPIADRDEMESELSTIQENIRKADLW